MNGRHYKMLFVITMQYGLGILQCCAQTSITSLSSAKTSIAIASCSRNYAGMFPNFEMFDVSNSAPKTRMPRHLQLRQQQQARSQVFWYKADQHEDPQLGAPELKYAPNAHNRPSTTPRRRHQRRRPPAQQEEKHRRRQQTHCPRIGQAVQPLGRPLFLSSLPRCKIYKKKNHQNTPICCKGLINK